MKVFAIHDTTGNISAIVTAPDKGATARMVMEGGSLMTEVELPSDLNLADGDEGDINKLAEVVTRYCVAQETRVAKLKRRQEKAK